MHSLKSPKIFKGTERCKNCLRTVYLGKGKRRAYNPTPCQLTSSYQVTDSTRSLAGDP